VATVTLQIDRSQLLAKKKTVLQFILKTTVTQPRCPITHEIGLAEWLIGFEQVRYEALLQDSE
jgi:hypothetical protein